MDVSANNHAELVRMAYGRLFAGDLDGFLDCLGEDCVVHEAQSLPYGGTHKGREGIRHLVTRIMDTWQVFRFDIEEVLSGPDTAIAYGRMTVAGKNTGASASFPLAEHWRIRDNRVIEITAIYGDTHRARQAAGDDK